MESASQAPTAPLNARCVEIAEIYDLPKLAPNGLASSLTLVASPQDPVEQIAALVGPASGWLTASTGPPDSAWLRCSDVLSNPDVLAEWDQALAHQLPLLFGPSDDTDLVRWVRLVEWYLSIPATLAATGFTALRRVPNIRPGALAFRTAPGYPYPHAVRLLDRSFWCLPSDEAADHPDARVVADQSALANLVRERLGEHAVALFAAMPFDVQLGNHQRWGLLTDVLDKAVWTTGVWQRRLPDAVESARVLLGNARDQRLPLRAGSTLYEFVDDRGRTQWARNRVTCCYNFRLPGMRDQLCFTCPRTSQESRSTQAANWSVYGPPV
jgi:hypothetical protein